MNRWERASNSVKQRGGQSKNDIVDDLVMVEEIATKLNMTPANVRSTIARAMVKMKKAVKERPEEFGLDGMSSKVRGKYQTEEQ